MFGLGIWYDHEPVWAADCSDEALLETYWEAENPEILAILINRYAPLIQLTHRNFITDDDSVCELASELYQHLHKRLKPEVEVFAAWFKTVIRNLQINRAVRHVKRKSVEDSYGVCRAVSVRPQIESSLSWQTHLDRIESLLNTKEYDLLMRKYYWHKSFKEIAAEKNISVKSVENICYRAKEKLRNGYPDAGLDFVD